MLSFFAMPKKMEFTMIKAGTLDTFVQVSMLGMVISLLLFLFTFVFMLSYFGYVCLSVCL